VDLRDDGSAESGSVEGDIVADDIFTGMGSSALLVPKKMRSGKVRRCYVLSFATMRFLVNRG